MLQIPNRTVGQAVIKTKKTFIVEPWDTKGEGEKVILYSETGMGKTTLCSMLPDPIFIALDEGGKKIRHPVTGKPLNRIANIINFDDVKDVLQQPDLFKNYNSVVIDTVTLVEAAAETWVLTNIPTEKGERALNMESYGWNKGYRHLYDAMRSLLQYTDNLIHLGKNVVFVAQSSSKSVPNPGGEDFLRDGPRLYAGKNWNVEALYCEYTDWIFRIAHQSTRIVKKKITGADTRIINTRPELHFRAKSRPIPEVPENVTFSEQADDSIWKFLFGGKQ